MFQEQAWRDSKPGDEQALTLQVGRVGVGMPVQTMTVTEPQAELLAQHEPTVVRVDRPGRRPLLWSLKQDFWFRGRDRDLAGHSSMLVFTPLTPGTMG
jgi:hypothetical protein